MTTEEIFRDELGKMASIEKSAIDVRDLSARIGAALRGNIVRLPTSMRFMGFGPPHMGAFPKSTLKPVASGGPTTGRDTSTQRMARSLRGKTIISKGGYAAPELKQMSDYASSMGKDPGFPKSLTGAERRAIDTVGLTHESFEHGVPKKLVRRFEPHANPGMVLSKEHNLLARLTGPGSDAAIKFERGRRALSGEKDTMIQFLRKHFGDRAVEMYTRGEKLPRAMRRRMAELWPER